MFKVLEPVIEKVDEKEIDQPPVESTFCLWSRQQEWFRDYRVCFVPPPSLSLTALTSFVTAILSAIRVVRFTVSESEDCDLVQQRV